MQKEADLNLSRGLELRRGSNMVFYLKLYSMILAGAQLKPVFGGYETLLKFVKFGLRSGTFLLRFTDLLN